jgi:NADH-quinone oxidoreductase subunit J
MYYLFFALIYIILSILILFSKNPIHSILYLILLVFLNVCLYFKLNCEFIGFIFLIIYIGAIAILFIFIIMMINIKIIELNETFFKYVPFSLLIAFILGYELYFLIDLFSIRLLFLFEFSNYKININNY